MAANVTKSVSARHFIPLGERIQYHPCGILPPTKVKCESDKACKPRIKTE